MTGSGTENFSTLLRALKDRTDLSYDALARRLRISASTLHRYCKGATVPADYAPVERYARLCRATPAELDALHRAWALAYAERTHAAAAEETAPDADGAAQADKAVVPAAPGPGPAGDDGPSEASGGGPVAGGSPPAVSARRPRRGRVHRIRRASQAVLGAAAAAAALTLTAISPGAGPVPRAAGAPSSPAAPKGDPVPTAGPAAGSPAPRKTSPAPRDTSGSAAGPSEGPSPTAPRPPAPSHETADQPVQAAAHTAETRTATLRGHANAMPYLDVFQGRSTDGTAVTTYEWTGEHTGRNQWWTVHSYEDGTVALESAQTPGKVLDLDRDHRGVLWSAASVSAAPGKAALDSGGLPARQRWKLTRTGNGWYKLVSMADGRCLYDRVTRGEPVMTAPCEAGNVWQEWSLGNGPSADLP